MLKNGLLVLTSILCILQCLAQPPHLYQVLRMTRWAPTLSTASSESLGPMAKRENVMMVRDWIVF